MKPLVIFFIFTLQAHAVVFDGLLREKGTKNPLPNVNVFALPSKTKAVTDESGRFSIDVPDGKFTWIVNLTGYKKLEKDDDTTDSAQRNLFLEKNSYHIYETTIYGRGEKRDDTTKSLKAAQFLNMPGSGGDPVKAVQNLPGVNRPAPFQSQIIIQGSGPQDTRYLVDGHEVPLIFHFGGLTSVVVPDAIDRVDFLAAGYGPEFGRANGGIVGLWTRKPKTDRTHGLAFMDLFNAGAMIEGPIGKKSSYLLSARRAYIGEVLRLAFKNNSDFNLSVAPSYSDFTGLYTTEISPKDQFRLSAIGSNDTLKFILKQPLKQDPSIRGDFYSNTAFYRFIPELEHRHSDRTITRYSLGLGQDFIKVRNSDNYFTLRTKQITARGELERKVTEEWTTYTGYDNRYTWSYVDVSFPTRTVAGGVPSPISIGSRRTATISNRYALIGAFWRNTLHWQDSRWTFLPNVRVDYFKVTNQILPAHRPAVRYALDDSLTLRAATGLYYQQPQEVELNSTFGNPNVTAPRAWHYNIGADKDFRNGRSDGWIVSVDSFYKVLENLVIPSTNLVNQNGKLVAENYNNKGSGKVYGAQTQIRYEANPWSVGVNYTVSRSTRTEPGQPEYVFQYDQTHLVGVVGAYDIKNWRFSSRFRYATGNPVTPLNGGTFDADGDVYIPRRGPYFSKRLEDFYQLDIRIDKKWIYDTWILSAYLDIQNVTNRANPEAIVYSYDYAQSDRISGLPILPTLGIKGEF